MAIEKFSDNTLKSNNDSPISQHNTRLIMIKLQHQLSEILKKQLFEPVDTVIANVSDLLINSLASTLKNFDKEKFKFELCKDDKAESLTVKPLNLLSALWLRGLDVSEDRIVNDHYEDSLAVYAWTDEHGMEVLPKDRRDLFSYEF